MNYDNKGVSKYELVEVVIPSTATVGSQYFFPDLPNLKNVKTEKLSAYNSALFALTPENYTPITSQDMKGVFLILNISDTEDIKMPLSNLVNIGNFSSAGVYFNSNGYIPLADLPIRWSKSYYKFVVAPTVGIVFSIPLGIFYR
jgi:hypothetical protein